MHQYEFSKLSGKHKFVLLKMVEFAKIAIFSTRSALQKSKIIKKRYIIEK